MRQREQRCFVWRESLRFINCLTFNTVYVIVSKVHRGQNKLENIGRQRRFPEPSTSVSEM